MKNNFLSTSVYILIFAIIICSCQKSVDTSASDIQALKASVSALQKRSDSLAAALAITNNNLGALSKTVDSIKTQLSTIIIQINQLNIQLTTVNANIVLINAQIVILNQQYADLLAKLNAILVQLTITPTSLDTGLAAYYPFTGNANDSSGNGNNGTINGCTLTSDRFGNNNSAYNFNGISNYISVANSSSLNITGNQISICYWIKFNPLLNDLNDKGISKGGYDLGSGYELDMNNNTLVSGGIHFNGAYGGYLVNNINQFGNKWIHVAASFNYGTCNIYINGIIQSSISTGNVFRNIVQNNYPLLIGTRTPGNSYVGYLNGQMDEVRIYNRALTQSEITYLATH